MSPHQLHKLVFKNDFEGLARFFQETEAFNIDEKFRQLPALHLAIQLNHVQCIRLLLSHGANSLVRNGQGFHALHEALSIGNMAVVEDIVKAQRKELVALSMANSTSRNSHQIDRFYIELSLDCYTPGKYT